MNTATILLSLSCGALVGLSLGLVGGGGSILATPLLLYVVGVANPHVAIGTSALAVAANASMSFVGHARQGHVWWRCAILFAILGALAALGGSLLGRMVDGQRLLALFAILMLVIAALMLRKRPASSAAPRKVDARMCAITGGAAAASGTLSGFFGIGGGFLIVPALVAATGMPMISAIGSSLLSVGAFGLATAGSYAAAGLIDWQVAVTFTGGGLVGGVVGTTLATRLAVRRGALERIFAGLIVLVAFYVLWRSVSAMMEVR